jgi:dTMP kinase
VGLFIAFEGGEGCGKSTQARRLANWLKSGGYDVLLTHEPGGTALGEELRRCLKKGRDGDVAAEAELLMFAAARSQLTVTRILPKLTQGGIVVCDRYTDSTIAYQGYGRGLSIDTISNVNRIATKGLVPDLVVLLDMDPAHALLRKKSARDRFEHESPAFHERVRNGYLSLAQAEPARWLVLDAAQSPSITTRNIRARVATLLNGNPTIAFLPTWG